MGLGLASHLPDTCQLIVLDGDGAALMRMEAMASIGRFCPSSLIHALLDHLWLMSQLEVKVRCPIPSLLTVSLKLVGIGEDSQFSHR